MSSFIRNSSLTNAFCALSSIQRSARTRSAILSTPTPGRMRHIGITATAASTPTSTISTAALTSQARRQTAQRSYSTKPAPDDAENDAEVMAHGYNPTGSGDLPWIIGTIAITVPVAFLLLRPMFKSKDEHGDHHHDEGTAATAAAAAEPDYKGAENWGGGDASSVKTTGGNAVTDHGVESRPVKASPSPFSAEILQKEDIKPDGSNTKNNEGSSPSSSSDSAPSSNKDTPQDKSKPSDQSAAEKDQGSDKDNAAAPKQGDQKQGEQEDQEEQREKEAEEATVGREKEINTPPKKDEVRDEVTPSEDPLQQKGESAV